MDVSRTEGRVEFLVQGSAAEPYVVVVARTGTNVTAHCSCPAGIVGQYCKHRFAILQGDGSAVVSENGSRVAEVAGWLAGSDLEAALRELGDREAELEVAKKRVASAKKAVARAMQD